tara:strand:- start:1563 stop:1955 length:393 start_codon:yes stop_codon:yes gene_type:complete
MAHEFNPGDVFVFSPGSKGIPCDDDPDWATAPILGRNKYMLYEEVSLTSYPSSSDFHGSTVEVDPGDVGIVLKVCGIPHMLWHYLQNKEKLRKKYTIYEVMVNNKKVNCFGGDMKAIVKYNMPKDPSSLS